MATYAKDDGVRGSSDGIADDLDQAQRLRDAAVSSIQERLGGFIFGYDGDLLPVVLAGQVANHDLRLAIPTMGAEASSRR